MANEFSSNMAKMPSTEGRRLKSRNDANWSLKTEYWKDMTKICFCPKTSEKNEYGQFKYEFDTFNDFFKKSGAVIILHPEERKVLCNGYINKIVPALKNNEQAEIGVPKGDSLLTISTNIDANGVAHPRLMYYPGIDPETKKCNPDDIMFYEFNTVSSIQDYAADTGTFKCVPEHVELEIFITDLEKSIEATSMVYAHANATNDKYFKAVLMERIAGICEKNGVPTKSNRGYNGGGGKGDIFNSSSFTPQDAVSNESVVNSIEDLPI